MIIPKPENQVGLEERRKEKAKASQINVINPAILKMRVTEDIGC